MRIIAGKYRRRKLHTSPGLTTRPVTDRAKEILFEHLRDVVPGRRAADVFAGTGSLGLEALSRDAAGVVFIENDRQAFDLLKQNVAMLGIERDTLCWRTDAVRCSYRPRGVPHLVPFDLVFFDPPYRMIDDLRAGSPIHRALERLARDDVTSSGALLVLRTPERAEFEMPGRWRPWQELPRLDISSMEMHLYAKAGPQPEQQDRPPEPA